MKHFDHRTAQRNKPARVARNRRKHYPKRPTSRVRRGAKV